MEAVAEIKKEHATKLENLAEEMDDMNQHDDNSTSFLMRMQEKVLYLQYFPRWRIRPYLNFEKWTWIKEAVKVEAELTRDVLAEGLTVMAADVKSHKEKSHSAVKALQEKFD